MSRQELLGLLALFVALPIQSGCSQQTAPVLSKQASEANAPRGQENALRPDAMQDELARLNRENAALKAQIDQLNGRLEKPGIPAQGVPKQASSDRWSLYEITTLDDWLRDVKQGTILKTASGNVYEVTDVVFLFEFELKPEVTVITDGRAYKLFIDKVKEKLACKKLNNSDKGLPDDRRIIKSRIVSDFEGTSSGNVYKLENGQVWKQTDDYIRIRIAVSPRVTIRKDGSSYKMAIEGIDREVAVELLN